jgi:replicative DNA helicase
LLDPSQVLPPLIERLPEEAFYDLRHRRLYAHLASMVSHGRPVDASTLIARLSVGDELEKLGGAGYVSTLPDATPTALNWETFHDMVRDLWLRRRVIATLTASCSKVFQYTGDRVDQLLDEVERDVLAATEVNLGVRTIRPLSAALEILREAMDNASRGKALIEGLSTGFSYWDKMTGGLHPGEMVVLGGRPSLGKTALAMNIVENVAIGQSKPVGVLSMEMQDIELALRMLCARGKANMHHVRTGFASNQDLECIIEVWPAVQAAPIFVDDTPSLDITQLRARARRMVQQYDCRLLVVDYLQLATAKGADGQVDRITQVSAGLKAMTRELGVPVLVLSQLSREIEKDGKRKPRLSDIRDSGAVEQDADVVVMLHRPHKKDDGEKEVVVEVNLEILKQRNGPLGTVKLAFFPEQTRFVDRFAGQGDTEHDVVSQASDLPRLAV